MDGPIKPGIGDGHAVRTDIEIDHARSCSGHPRPVDWIYLRRQVSWLANICVSSAFPRKRVSRSGMAPEKGATGMIGNPLTVAGAATVLVPCWVVRTVFPINPLGVIVGEPSGAVKPRRMTRSSRTAHDVQPENAIWLPFPIEPCQK
jgi:hypothetical protein